LLLRAASATATASASAQCRCGARNTGKAAAGVSFSERDLKPFLCPWSWVPRPPDTTVGQESLSPTQRETRDPETQRETGGVLALWDLHSTLYARLSGKGTIDAANRDTICSSDGSRADLTTEHRLPFNARPLLLLIPLFLLFCVERTCRRRRCRFEPSLFSSFNLRFRIA
jgi:hypothetical protein